VGQTQAWPVLDKKFDNFCVVCDHINWPSFDHGLHSGMKVFNGICHVLMLANMLTTVNVTHSDKNRNERGQHKAHKTLEPHYIEHA
jgi:hypothetical protein